jgi:transcriptional regulator with XRE-family HTH domain
MTLRDLRLKRGLTLEALGYLGDVDQSTVSRIERGLIEPTPETVVKLARALGISVQRFRTMLPTKPQNGEVEAGAA